ncbi:MAG: radical SAM protein [Patescibacteria group bacterium]
MNKIIRKLKREESFMTGRYNLAPEFLSLIITFRCNFRCQSCSIWQKPPIQELSENEWLGICRQAKEVFTPETFVEINGGEALLRKELVISLIKTLKPHFKNVALNSNGLLISKEIAKELEKSGLDLLKISFYSLNEDIHNSLRGHPQAFCQAKKALELIDNSRIKLEVGVLMMAKNMADLPELIKYLKTLNNANIILQPLDESIESEGSKNRAVNQTISELWPAKEETAKFFDWVLENYKNYPIKNSLASLKAMQEYYLQPSSVLKYRCFAGQRNLVVYPQGDVAMCFKGRILGNLTKENLSEILKGEAARQERQNIRRCQKYCRIIGCNFSRGLLEVFKG